MTEDKVVNIAKKVAKETFYEELDQIVKLELKTTSDLKEVLRDFPTYSKRLKIIESKIEQLQEDESYSIKSIQFDKDNIQMSLKYASPLELKLEKIEKLKQTHKAMTYMHYRLGIALEILKQSEDDYNYKIFEEIYFNKKRQAEISDEYHVGIRHIKRINNLYLKKLKGILLI